MPFLSTRRATPACIALLVAFATLVDPGDAHACSVASSCGVDHLPAGALVPSNAPALGFDWATGSWVKDVDVAIVDSAGITLLEATKVAVPGALNLGAKLVSGDAYSLRVKPSGSTCDERVSPFRSGPPAPSPQRVGTASVSYKITTGGVRSGGYMGGPIVNVYDGTQVATADIAIVPDETLAPYLSLVRFETFLDGEGWSSSERGGGVKRSGGDTDVTTVPDFTRIYAYCPSTTASDASTSVSTCFRSGTAPGPHEVEIRANVPGIAVPLEPIRLSIDLRCPSSPAAANPAAANASPAVAAGGGCSVGSPPSTLWPTAFLLAATTVRRRRRNQ